MARKVQKKAEITRKPEKIEEIDPFSALDRKDKAILKIMIEYPEMPCTEVARRCNIHINTLTKRKNKAHFKRFLKKYTDSALQLLLDAQAEAARVLQDALKDKDKKTRILAAKEILKGILKERMVLEGDEQNPIHIKHDLETIWKNYRKNDEITPGHQE